MHVQHLHSITDGWMLNFIHIFYKLHFGISEMSRKIKKTREMPHRNVTVLVKCRA